MSLPSYPYGNPYATQPNNTPNYQTSPYATQPYNPAQDNRQSISQAWADNSLGGPLNVYRSDTGATHSYSHEERRSFVAYINDWLKNDPDLRGVLPLNPESEDLFTVVATTPILCKLVNVIAPGTIDERRIRTNVAPKDAVFAQNENISLGIDGCKQVGLVVANLGVGDIAGGKPHMILGLIWQIIKKGLLSKINMDIHPELSMMLSEYETTQHLLNAPPEQNLLRWFNFQLKKTQYPKDVHNFKGDITDGQAYLALLEAIAPEFVPKGVFQEPDLNTRVDWVCAYANQMGCGGVIAPEDIKRGNDKLNLAFTAYLFNKYPGLDTWSSSVDQEALNREKQLAELREQQEREFRTREEQLKQQYALQEQELQQKLLRQQQEKEELKRREEGEKQAKMFEEARLRHEAELEAARQAEAEQRRQYEAMLRYQEQQRLAQEEAKKREEEDRRQEEERRRRQEEEDRRRRIEEAERIEAERRRALEEEARRKAQAEEEARLRALVEEEARRRAWDEYNKQQAHNAQLQAEEERRRAAWDEYNRQEALKQEQARLSAEEEERKRQQAWAEYNAQQEAMRQQQEALRQQQAAQQAIAMANEAALKAAAAQQAAAQAAAVQQQLLAQQQTIIQQKAQQEALLRAQQAEALRLAQQTVVVAPQRPTTSTTTITKTTIHKSVFPIKRLTIRVKRAARLIKKNSLSRPDPYIKSLFNGNYQRSTTLKSTYDPVFEYDFEFLNVDKIDIITFQVYDDNQITKDEFLGEVRIVGSDCGHSGLVREYDIKSREHRTDRVHGTLIVEFKF